MRAELAAGASPLALVVLRSPELQRLAWKRGRRAARALERAIGRAFLTASAKLARARDVAAHDSGSDCFVLAMLDGARGSPGALDGRAAQERIAAAVAHATGERLEGGWSLVESDGDIADAGVAIARALERGARERERFEFLAAVGHELRTPLTSIRGYIETVLDESVREPVDARSARIFLGSALRETQRLSRLVDGMLEFSLLDLSGRGCGSQACDAGDAARAARDAVRLLALECRARVSICAGEGGCARIAPDALAHVLVNVLENALKHGRRPNGRVRVACKRVGPYIRITVDDDGPGVALAERDAIFAMGVRGAGATARGSGIGLAIVRSVVERAGGRVDVERSPWGGARFAIRLARAESEPATS